jgi:hypothetical protein
MVNSLEMENRRPLRKQSVIDTFAILLSDVTHFLGFFAY